MKGMVFAGCSFTWGEGLHLYSDVCDISYTKNQNFNIHNIKESHKKCIQTNRFARKVANHFNTFELTRTPNGGSNNQIFDFIVRDFSKFALELHNKPSSTEKQMDYCRKLMRKPNVDNTRYEAVWTKYVYPLKGTKIKR